MQRTYQHAIHLLNSLQSNAATIAAIKASGGTMNQSALVEMREYLSRVGHQATRLNELNAIHITGTKGKGSTSAFCDSILRSLHRTHSHDEPLKVGLYTSPHLVAVRERIRINGVPLSEDRFAKYFFEVWDQLEANPAKLAQSSTTPSKPVYFRYLTLLAFHTFLSEKVDTSIFEVGIGGAFDSTNIIPRPVVAGVTSLGLDHTHLLGETIGEVAWNKGGIYKENVPALSVEQPENGVDVLRKRADDIHASSFTVVPLRPELNSLKLGLAGTHQKINASLALSLIHTLLNSPDLPASSGLKKLPAPTLEGSIERAVQDGLEKASWPGRCQVVCDQQVRWFLDGAHTVESLVGCSTWWGEEVRELIAYRKRVLIFNCTNGRSAQSLLSALLLPPSDNALGPLQFDKVIFSTNTTYASGQSKGDLQSSIEDNTLTVQNDLSAAFRALLPQYPSAEIHLTRSIEEAVELVRALPGDNQAVEVDCLVTGSLHLVGGLMDVAGIVEEGLKM